MAGKEMQLAIRLAGTIDKSLIKSLKTASEQLSGLSRALRNVGNRGLKAMGGFAGETVKALSACADEAESFGQSMAGVVKYVDGLADANGRISDKIWGAADGGNGKTFRQNYDEMSRGILELSTQIPLTQKQLTEMAAAAGQSGKSISDLIQYDSHGNITGFLRDIAMAAAALDIDPGQAGGWAAKWEKSLDMTHDEVMVLFDQISYLGANSAAAAAEIAEVVNGAAALDGIAQMDPASAVALADAMLATGVEAGAASANISQMLVNLSKGESATKAQQEAWKELGFTASGVARSMQKDAAGTLLSVLEAIGNLDAGRQADTLNTLFGQWAAEGAAKLTGNLAVYEQALQMVSNPEGYTGRLLRQFESKSGTDEAIDQMMRNAVESLKIDIGTKFLPVKEELSAIIKAFSWWQKNLSKITPHAKQAAQLLSGGKEALKNAMSHVWQMLNGLPNQGGNTSLSVQLGQQLAGAWNKSALGGYTGGIWDAGKKLLDTRIGSGALHVVKDIHNTSMEILGGIADATGLADLWSGTQRLARTGWGAAKTGMGWLSDKAGGAVRAAQASRPGQFVAGAFSTVKGVAGKVVPPVKEFAGAGGGLLSSIIGPLAGQFGGLLDPGASMKQFAGKGLLTSVWGPVASGFGSLLAGAVPVVGAISGIIAVVSILGDHLGSIRGIVGKVFGDQGIAVFDAFTGQLAGIGKFVAGLFEEGGVAKALGPLREGFSGLLGGGGLLAALFGGQEGGLAAFDGVVGILQSIMGVAEQLVQFADGTVKPVIEQIFGFLVQNVVPTILSTFTAAAPSIAGTLSGLGTAVMTAMQIIGAGIQWAMPVISGLAQGFLNITSVVIPAVLGAWSIFAGGIQMVMESICGIFGGLIDFITGIFTGSWELAWNGVKEIFGSAFDALVVLFKTPLNAVISLINLVIEGINGLGLIIPDWVPVIGGSAFGINIPTIPQLARGGFTNGPSIAGEAGREAVISFLPGVRAANIATWLQAGRMLGGKRGDGRDFLAGPAQDGPVVLKDPGWEQTDSENVTFAPQIIVQGSADAAVLDEAMEKMWAQFDAWYEQRQRRRARVAY